MTPATALPALNRPAHELSGEKYTAQAKSPVTPLARIRVETYHGKLCQLIAAEYAGRAYANELALRPETARTETDRANAFTDLGRRLRLAARGERQIVRECDSEAVRWYHLTLLRRCLTDGGVKQKSRELKALSELLAAALAGDVENLTAAVRRA